MVEFLQRWHKNLINVIHWEIYHFHLTFNYVYYDIVGSLFVYVSYWDIVETESQSLIEKETVFKTQGQSYNMDDLIKSTLLKEPVLESIVPNIYEKVMTKAEVHLIGHFVCLLCTFNCIQVFFLG
jgi:uncharacterized membrane protein YwzB